MNKKILLLTDIPPSENLTAGIFINHLCSFIPNENLAIFTVLNPYLDPEIPDRYQSIPQQTVEKPFEGWGHRNIRVVKSLYMESRYALKDLPRIAEAATSFGKEWGADVLWVILQGQMMIRLAKMVSKRLQISVYPQVMDPPDWWFRGWKVNPVHTYLFLKTYDQVIRSAEKVGVASPAMAEAYRQKYKVEAVPIVSPLDRTMAVTPDISSENLDANRDLVLGIAGQLYARQEWDTLLNALDKVNWRISGRNVWVKLLGDHDPINFTHEKVEVLGWKSQAETISILSQLDILYCPYWFDPVFEQEARYCFPSKLTSYLAAGRPVFVHSPEYASPAVFVRDNRAGVVCSSLEETKIIEALSSLIEDQATYNQYALNSHEAFHKHLTMDSVKEQFIQFLPLS